jgi:hypothetical protein
LRLLLTAAAANAQQALSVGVTGGAPFTSVVNGNTVNSIQSISKSTNFTIGGAIQVNLPLNLRIEVDGLFRPWSFNLTSLNVFQDISAQQYSFPVLLEYRLPGPPLIKPFVEAGLQFDRLAGISAAAKSTITSGPGELLHQSDASIVLGAGIDVKVPKIIRFSGELRYIAKPSRISKTSPISIRLKCSSASTFEIRRTRGDSGAG